MKRRTSRFGFTLIELLVVVAVIALLASLLLPTLTGVRKQARIVQCTSFLRQHAVAHNTYALDYNGYFPLFGGTLEDIPGYGWDATSVYDHAEQLAEPVNTLYWTTYVGRRSPLHQCPVVDWSHYGAFTFTNPYVLPHHNGAVAYTFYTGRRMHNTMNSFWSHDTTLRRNDPLEILVTDMLVMGWQTADYGPPYNTRQDPLVPWFNPHADRSCLPWRAGMASQALADGRVVSFSFPGPLIYTLTVAYNYGYAKASKIGPTSSATDGPYFVWDGNH